MHSLIKYIATVLLLLLIGCGTSKKALHSSTDMPSSPATADATPLAPKEPDVVEGKLAEELRGAWVATVANIDWPSSPSASTETKKQEIDKILKRFSEIGINAVFLQVRPSYGTLYPSAIEPWSRFYTDEGSQETFDPLKYWIDECHSRGMELHAWINPYRTLFSPSDSTLQSFLSHQEHPEWYIHYGKHLYMDPGYPQTRTYVLSLIAELVKNYDVDGIHFDDYFYPYTIPGQTYHDESSFMKFGGTFPSKADWRRCNVNHLILDVHNYLKVNAPLVKFGVAPFGVWRNKKDDPRGSDTESGITSYDDLYADVIYWSEQHWIDYVAPQIYWPVGFQQADYKTLAYWWNNHVPFGDIYVGHSTYRFSEDAPLKQWTHSNELRRQVLINRDLPNIKGNIFYNTSSLMNNPLDIIGLCENDLYAKNALVPNMPWKHDTTTIPTPLKELNILYPPKFDSTFSYQKQLGITLSWQSVGHPRSYIITRQRMHKSGKVGGKEEIIAVLPGTQTHCLDAGVHHGRYYKYRIVSVGKNSQYSPIETSRIVRAHH